MKPLQSSASPSIAAAHLTKLSGLILHLVHSPPAVHMNSLLLAKGSAMLVALMQILRKKFGRVWSLQVPHKIKHFIWRACNDALPTMSNLFRRQVSSSDRCELCQLYPQDPLHALWSCKEVETAWNSLNCLQQPSHPQPQPQNFCDLLACFL